MPKHFRLFAFIAFILLSFFAGTSYYLFQREASSIHYQYDASQILLKGASKVNEIWNQAPIQFACGELSKLVDVNPVYFKNNPEYLDCFLRKGKILVRHQQHEFYVKARRFSSGKFYKIVTKENDDRPMIPNYGVLIELEVEGEPKQLSLSFILQPSELEVFLPHRVYAYGTFKERGDWRFDTFGRNIFIDRFLVSFRDIAEWVYFARDKRIVDKINFPTNKSEWVKPASGLSILQMQAFCAFRGKQLLPAYLFDAASFFPPDQDDTHPAKVVRGPYPWTYQRRFLFTQETEFDVQFCSKIYSASCIGQAPFEFYDNRTNSWIGMSQILGGHMEYLTNPLFPQQNIKTSSFYFDFRSPWHQLGARASWDGEAWSYKHFDWSAGENPLGEYTQYKVGFRCMREVDYE